MCLEIEIIVLNGIGNVQYNKQHKLKCLTSIYNNIITNIFPFHSILRMNKYAQSNFMHYIELDNRKLCVYNDKELRDLLVCIILK